MTALLLTAAVVTGLAAGLIVAWLLPRRSRPSRSLPGRALPRRSRGGRGPRGSRGRRRDESGDSDGGTARRILLPFTGTSISRRSLEAAIRLARAEDAIIMPAFLASVPRHLPLGAPLPAQCLQAMPLLEAIEQRAIAAGVRVDARVGRGRSFRDALRQVIADEPVDRIIVSASANPRGGPSAQDLQWLLTKAPTEVLILRPAPEDDRRVSADNVVGHF
ncbi:hypothetical protein DSM112329_00652 [Paraconexibacter sp. AEG42_29]|uniref:Universal stress protein n=1 Tax=Paraconexibacter sp. AEG42_29 TaxID=2997339 RepID=A0AAU7AQC2_9ACTN